MHTAAVAGDVRGVGGLEFGDSVVEVVRVGVGGNHQAGQDDEVGDCPMEVGVDTILHLLSLCLQVAAVLVQLERCQIDVSILNSQSFWTAGCALLRNVEPGKSKEDKHVEQNDCYADVPQTSSCDGQRKHFEGSVGKKEREKGCRGS